MPMADERRPKQQLPGPSEELAASNPEPWSEFRGVKCRQPSDSLAVRGLQLFASRVGEFALKVVCEQIGENCWFKPSAVPSHRKLRENVGWTGIEVNHGWQLGSSGRQQSGSANHVSGVAAFFRMFHVFSRFRFHVTACFNSNSPLPSQRSVSANLPNKRHVN